MSPIAEFIGGRSYRLCAATLLGCVLVLSFLAAADSGSPEQSPLFLSRKAASKLILIQVRPEYPPIAKVNYIQGQVHLQVRVTRQGKVSQVHVVEGNPLLAQAALEAVHKWVYRPYVTKSGPAEFETLVDVRFNLQVKEVSDIPPNSEAFFDRGVHPPQALKKPAAFPSRGPLRLRLLISDQGQVLDSKLLSGPISALGAAQKDVESWKFKPARWGNQAIPSYLDVDVEFDPRQALRGGSRNP